MLKIRLLARPSNLFFLLLILAIIFNPFVIVNAGERGVLMVFGQVQDHLWMIICLSPLNWLKISEKLDDKNNLLKP
jgi:regulator of protease activity HflC (stomatin/prohibitin superfamily)